MKINKWSGSFNSLHLSIYSRGGGMCGGEGVWLSCQPIYGRHVCLHGLMSELCKQILFQNGLVRIFYMIHECPMA